MLKGHVFKEQIFGNQIFALFINTFLNGKNGISNNYKNGMAITHSGSTLTVQSGAICIQGRFIEEDTSTDILAGTDTAFCKLVLEIDLSKQNTVNELNQVNYKIIKSMSSYPILTQNDIIKNDTGIYQYELARFKTGTNGITDFQDMRTFLDFDSIYKIIEDKINDIEDGSIYKLKSDEVVLYENKEGSIGDIILNDTVANYTYIKISFKRGTGIGTGELVKIQEFENVNNNEIVLESPSITQLSDTFQFGLTYAKYSIKENEIKRIYEDAITFRDNSIYHHGITNVVAITKVIGYK